MADQKRDRTRHGLGRASVLLWLAGIAGVVVIALVWRAASGDKERNTFAHLLQDQPIPGVDSSMEERIKAFCGDCHAVPRPASFPRYAWHTEVRMGYEFYAKSGRTDLDPPPIYQTVNYYRSRAPEQLEFPRPAEAQSPLKVQFRTETLRIDATGGVAPAVSHLHWLPLTKGDKPVLVVTDMRRGTVLATPLPAGHSKPRLLATLENPCHVEPCDLDHNGTIDLLVADLGSFPPGDHHRGRVVWLRRRPDADSYDPVVIADGLGRVADVQPADFDADGDMDLIVAVFGMDRTGKTLLMRNISESPETLHFKSEVLDPRPGVIHVPPCDLTGDGHLDFVALISQEYEEVVAFVNSAGSNHQEQPFHAQTLWAGPDLTFGSSGIKLVDLDSDDDIDVLYTNGDAFDNGFVNPSHGVQWLENKGGLEFTYHRLTDLVGAYVAAAGDIDLDGDMDILAGAWLPGEVEPANVLDRPLPTLICLEQTAPGTFVRHTLEKDAPIHAALELADFDEDGDLDLAVGSHTLARSKDLPHWVAVWWNQLKSPVP